MVSMVLLVVLVVVLVVCPAVLVAQETPLALPLVKVIMVATPLQAVGVVVVVVPAQLGVSVPLVLVPVVTALLPL
jgi:hypothetical protein